MGVFAASLLAIGLVRAENSVAQGYGADSQLQRGLLVSLQKADPTKVESTQITEESRLQGVVIAQNDAPVTLSSENNKVFVAASGRFEVLVSNQNGSIGVGDYVSPSALNGIGMKTATANTVVVGKALVPFDGSTSLVDKTTVKLSDGSTKEVSIARIMVDISIAKNPTAKVTQELPDILQRAAQSIANKTVSPFRVYFAIAVLVISTILSAIIIYGGISSSIISIGRNPLSKKSITRGLVQVILTGIVIFMIGLAAVYLLLKL